MMESRLNKIYDVAIIGGGLAGLATSIELGRKGYYVILLEKEQYPFHKVCGEYVSMESWNYLNELGLELTELNLPHINTLHLSAPNGNRLVTPMDLGGFGMSRFLLDQELANLAKANGVELVQQAKVTNIHFNDLFEINYESGNSSDNKLHAKVCCASYGKRSNLDAKLKRNFIRNAVSKRDNYIAVKYHVRTNQEKNIIGLHHFKDGYAGISAIENECYCFCYMTRAEQLKKNKNSIDELEKNVLATNPYLKEILSSLKKENGFPITISQIRFDPKTTIESHVLMLGDAAGTIAPLCGNGMSMALHSAKLVSPLIDSFLLNKINRNELETEYSNRWKKEFGRRIKVGSNLQKITGGITSANLFIGLMKRLPFFGKKVIQLTHGQPF